ncbi:MAG: segregation/condensation protein A [Betaproteobacteria bacterium]|nr:segregation/condensation protein A [Betaproteobacteria bacterium]
MNAPGSPVAVVAGRAISEYPQSLYVPPNALKVLLENFEGPLDLLHFLIRRNNVDILDIPMAEITRQYLEYVDCIIDSQLELAADYLLMSATLIEIKSRMLLPEDPTDEEESTEDPRAELVRRLLVYSRIKAAAEHLGERPRCGRDFIYAHAPLPPAAAQKPRVDLAALARALLAARERARGDSALNIEVDAFTVREAMAHLLAGLRRAGKSILSRLLGIEHASRQRVGVFFVAILQLAKEQLVRVEQVSDSEIAVVPRKRSH